VLGIVLILREMRDEHERPRQEEADEHQFAGASSALRALALGLIPSMIALGVLLALAVQAHKRFGSLDPQDLRALRD
jgi:hypothetical protein